MPFDGLAFILILLLLDIETPKTPLVPGLKAVDWLGCITIVGGTVMFLLGLEYGGVSHPWDSAIVVCLIVFGLLTMGLFLLCEWKLAKYPIMPLRIFKYRSNIASLGVAFCHGLVFISGAFFLPLYFQAVFGATPILSGVYLFPYVITLSFTSAIVGIFIKKTGQYLLPIWVGFAALTLGFGLFIDLPYQRGSWARVIIFQIIAGIGVGPGFQAPLIALQSKVHPRDIATASATFYFIRNLATAMSIVIGGVVFQNGMRKREDTLARFLPLPLAQRLGSGGAGSSSAIVAKLEAAQRIPTQRAYTDSLKIIWVLFTCVAAVGLAISLLIGKQTLSREHQVQKQGLEEQERARRERKAENAAKKMLRKIKTRDNEGEKPV